MGSLQEEEKQEMDDSGYIQDAPPPTKNGYYQQVQLLDLSDDVLLLILKHLAPRDLKALGFTCPRLGALVLDRSLWVYVDARAQPWSSLRLRWYLARALHAGTKKLLISGYAREISTPESRAGYRTCQPRSGCPGESYTVAPLALRQLADTCARLASLALEYCNIDCNITSISNFPPTLKELSLQGSKCYDLPLERSFLFKIQDYLPGLESLDVCECEWMEPAALLPLSKLPALRRLAARDCARLTEFVAYASLATRYGFLKLQHLDLRGSPVGDSEVSALGWLAALRTLLLAPARAQVEPVPIKNGAPRQPEEELPPRYELPPPLDKWEENVPDYYKFTVPLELPEESRGGEKWSCERTETSEHKNSTKTDDSDGEDKPSKRKQTQADEGPSKRTRTETEPPNSDPPLNPGPSTSRRREPANTERDAEPRHHILNVNVGQQLHVVYRVSSQNDHVLRAPVFDLRVNPRSGPSLHTPLHLDATSLVTDAAVRRFGRADGEDINYVHIGPNGPYAAANLPGTRPNRSSLRYLSITGFRHITDRSLVHLATAAPELEFLDLSGTNVTERGVEKFRSVRPDCKRAGLMMESEGGNRISAVLDVDPPRESLDMQMVIVQKSTVDNKRLWQK